MSNTPKSLKSFGGTQGGSSGSSMAKSLKNKRRFDGGSLPQYNWGFAGANTPSEHGFCEMEIGTVLKLDEQEYELTGFQDFIRGDGSTGKLIVWSTACPVCGCAFIATGTWRSTHLNRRCASCAKKGKPVKGKRGRKVRVTVIPA